MPQKVTVEILGPEKRPDLTLEPFLRSREEARLIKLLQSIPDRRAFAVFFERHGCFHCGRRDVPHAASACCAKCRRWAYYEMSKIKKELAKSAAL